MNTTNEFNTASLDSQATPVAPVPVSQFDFSAYEAYEQSLRPRCAAFWKADSGVLVYRRMRVREVFADGCADKLKSLEWQLGALRESMKYKTDVPNFLEPWYGIGTLASALGLGYLWEPGQAPAVSGKFATTREALEAPARPVAETGIGQATLDMVSYFLEQTRGRLPLSYCDVQSPFNAAANLVDTTGFMMDFYSDPEAIALLLDKLAGLLIDFTRLQKELIGPALALPGHGFASSRAFEGFGMSDDSVVMLSDKLYQQWVIPSFVKAGEALGGPVFHSCGNWGRKIAAIKGIRGLRMVDGAFSRATDPAPNDPAPFGAGFAGSGVVVNARVVGGPEQVGEVVRQLWRPGMKLIVVTYCATPEEQARAYDVVHQICGM
jgi:hypothetical protein